MSRMTTVTMKPAIGLAACTSVVIRMLIDGWRHNSQDGYGDSQMGDNSQRSATALASSISSSHHAMHIERERESSARRSKRRPAGRPAGRAFCLFVSHREVEELEDLEGVQRGQGGGVTNWSRWY